MLKPGPFLFQHDCAPVHKARSIKTWMTESGVDELDWPAQSPDLNPIEYLWDELERRLRARPSRPTSVCDLTNALLEEWSKIPINTLLNLVDSLPRRVEAVIAAKGGPTSY
uniref:Tc1-like transposase DDE domain-containing protein n=1 Tax=Myripristis murdjan TaxID=586833 RepID=A0A667WWW4_9TELE